MENNQYKLYNNDFQKITLPQQVDMILVDPPYGTTHCEWDTTISFEEMWAWIEKHTGPHTPILIFGTEPFSSQLRLSSPYYKYDIIWDKVVAGSFLNANKQPLRRYENICVFYKKQPTYNPQMTEGREENHPHKTTRKTNNVYGKHHEVPTKRTKLKYPSNIVRVNCRCNECNNTKRVHPTQKPVELLEYLIRTYTDSGDTVLDFTMGSGSTGVASIQSNRKFIGIEVDPEYYQLAKKRIQQSLDLKPNVKVEDYFGEHTWNLKK